MCFKDSKLTTNAAKKDIVYWSMEKLDDLLIPDEKQYWDKSAGVSLSASATGVGASANASVNSKKGKMSLREKLTEAGKFLKKQNNLCYEDNPQAHSYLLIRLVASAGTMWPWSGYKEGMENTAWWVGEGKDVTVLAYGSLKNLRQGRNPDPERKSESDTSTWYPSVITTGYDLINGIKVNSGEEEVPEGLEVRAPLEECFNGGLFARDAPPLEGPGIYEMLLRVDGVDKDTHKSGAVSKKPIVYGSPIWVARALTPAPGVYKLHQEEHPNPVGIRIQDMTHEMTGYARGEGLKGNLKGSEIAGSGLDAYGVWDGKSWIKTYWGRGIYRMAIDNSADVPETPQGSPSLTDAVSLGIPLNLRKKFFKRWEWDKAPLPSREPILVIIG